MNNLEIQKSVFEKMTGDIPDYKSTMYLEGYKPYQILQACRKSMINRYYEQEIQKEQAEPMNVKMRVEVKQK